MPSSQVRNGVESQDKSLQNFAGNRASSKHRSSSPRSRSRSPHRSNRSSSRRRRSRRRSSRSRSYSRSRSPPVRPPRGRSPRGRSPRGRSPSGRSYRRSPGRSRSRSRGRRRDHRMEMERGRDRLRGPPRDYFDNYPPRMNIPPHRPPYPPPYDPYYQPPPFRRPPPMRPIPPRRREDNTPAGVSLLVRNISPDMTSSELQAAFGRIGRVRDVYIPRDYHSQQPKGFAFVEFASSDQAKEAQAEMDHFSLKGRELEVVFAQERRKTPNEMRGRVVSDDGAAGFDRNSNFDRYQRNRDGQGGK